MVDTVMQITHSLQQTSRVLSTKGAQEEAALQEAMIQLLGFMSLEGREPEVVSIVKASEGKFHPCKLQEFKRFFASGDVQAVCDEAGKFTSVLYFIESEEDFDTVPLFVGNYLSADMIPSVLGFCVEKLELDADSGAMLTPHYALPYFTITKFNGEAPDPTIAFVGKELRMRYLREKDAVASEASGIVAPYLQLSALMLQGQGVDA